MDLGSRPFFTYFNIKEKFKCEIETLHIIGSDHSGQGSIALFSPGSSLRTSVFLPLLWGKRLPIAQGGAGR